MSVPVLYAFLVDDALKPTGKVESLKDHTQGYCQLVGESANYLVTPCVVNDSRRSRLMIVDNHQAYGRMSLHFDERRFDADQLRQMSDVEIALLFNIAERLYLQQEYSDANIESMLLNSAAYRGYVPGSFTHSPVDGQATVSTTEGGQKVCTFWDWYSFEFEIESTKFRVHFWVSSKAFAVEYPYTTITGVIPPYDPKQLVDPVSLYQSGNMNVLTSGSQYIFKNVDLETVARDQNGVFTYLTKYVLDPTRSIQLPFALPYCGPKPPTSLECRKAIRDYLEEETHLGEIGFQAMFPELYVDSRFFVVPLWDRFTRLSDRIVYPSILPLSDISKYKALVFPDTDQDFLNQHLELLLNAQNKMWSMCLPDELNTEYFSILEQHPTYQDYAAHAAAGFRFMTAEDQDFAGKLNRCFAILNGEATSAEYVRTQIGTAWYLSFTSGKSEYLVMEKDSYLEQIANK